MVHIQYFTMRATQETNRPDQFTKIGKHTNANFLPICSRDVSRQGTESRTFEHIVAKRFFLTAELSIKTRTKQSGSISKQSHF